MSQSDRLTMAMVMFRSPGELGSKTSLPCSQIKCVLSTIAGRGIAAGRRSHRLQDRTNCAGRIAQGTFSKSRVDPVSALSCICFSLALNINELEAHSCMLVCPPFLLLLFGESLVYPLWTCALMLRKWGITPRWSITAPNLGRVLSRFENPTIERSAERSPSS